jgi:hypothetical protein
MNNEFLKLTEKQINNYNKWLEKIIKIKPIYYVNDIFVKRNDGYLLNLIKYKHTDCIFPNFILSDKQEEKIEKWEKSLKINKKRTVESDGYSYHFIIQNQIEFIYYPTGIGIVIKVKHINSEIELDLTDWENF